MTLTHVFCYLAIFYLTQKQLAQFLPIGSPHFIPSPCFILSADQNSELSGIFQCMRQSITQSHPSTIRVWLSQSLQVSCSHQHQRWRLKKRWLFLQATKTPLKEHKQPELEQPYESQHELKSFKDLPVLELHWDAIIWDVHSEVLHSDAASRFLQLISVLCIHPDF